MVDTSNFGVLDGGLEALVEFRKALEAGYEINPAAMTDYQTMKAESIETTLKMAVAEEKTVKFWKDLRKSKAESTVEQFITVTNYGRASFYTEAGLPEEYAEDMKREMENVKYIGAIGKVSGVVNAGVKSVQNMKAIQQKLKTIAMIRELNYKSFFANSENIGVEFNGFMAQFLKRCKSLNDNVIDLEGKCITPEILAKISLIIQENYGDPNNVKGYIAPADFNNYASYLIKNKTFMVGNNEVRDITSVPRTYKLGDGEGSMETDLFLRYKGQSYIDKLYPMLTKSETDFQSMHEKAPKQLDSTTATATVDDLTGSKLAAKTYDYAILPVNRYGAGKAFEITGVVVASNKKVVFSLSDNGSSSGLEAEAFEIYRRDNGTGTTKKDYRFLKTVKASATAKEDTGSEIPNSRYAFFFDWNPDQVLDFKQLCPMVKEPLAKVFDGEWWLQKLYGTPILYNPGRMVLLKNVGDSLTWS